MSEIHRYLTNRTGKERLGVLNENKILSIEYFADSIGLDIVEELEQIRQGKKKKEETHIDLEIKVLNSLSNAINALANYKKSESWLTLKGFWETVALFGSRLDWRIL